MSEAKCMALPADLSPVILAPAKINLFLHITGRRADGYHNLQSLMMRIDWCDRLAFALKADSSITRFDGRFGFSAPASLPPHKAGGHAPKRPLLVPQEDRPAQFFSSTPRQAHAGEQPFEHLEAEDLCVRAARALQRAGGCRLGAEIYLEKNIPSQAGLGGGSSDAATTLLVLNRLWGLDWGLDRLMEIGLGLGADVPFFLLQRHAWVEGVGEELIPVDLPLLHAAVIKPRAGVSTAAVFQHPRLRRNSAPLQKEAALSFFCSAQPDGRSDRAAPEGIEFRNDMQEAALELCPELDWSLEALRKGGLEARMTGSGSAVFALCGAGFDVNTVAPPSAIARVCSNRI